MNLNLNLNMNLGREVRAYGKGSEEILEEAELQS